MAALIWTGCFLAPGWLLTRRLSEENRLLRLWLALVSGLALAMWLPALWAFLLDFTPRAQWLAALSALVLAGGLAAAEKRWPLRPASDWQGWQGAAACCVPLWLFFCYLLHTHTLLAAADGSLHTGQSTYGDMAMHLAFITSLAGQQKFPPLYSLLPDTPLGYPFLCDSISSSYCQLGLGLRWAYMLPMVWAMACVLLGGYLLFYRWLKGQGRAAVAYWLFFGGGGFGFLYFLPWGGDWSNFTRIFTAFYETPTNYVEENIRWVNPVADLLVPQRATLFGWALLFACLYLLYRGALEEKKGYFVPLGLLAGALPLVHTHSFLALGLVSAVLLVRALLARPGWRKLAPWAVYAVLAVGLAAPQLFGFTFRQTTGEGFLRLGFNWANEGDNYFWFYIKNIGLVYCLLIPAFVRADKKSRWFYGGGLAILAISEFVIFQPNPYDNNKLLFVWHLLGCGLVAGLLADLWQRLKGRRWRGIAAGAVLALGTVGGALTLAREAVSDYQLFSAADTAAARWLADNSPADARVLTGQQHNNFAASLAGRNILCGSPSYLYYHGLDYAAESAAAAGLYQSPSLDDLESWGIDYVLVSRQERAAFAVAEDWFAQNLSLVFQQEDVCIYQVS